MDNKLYQKKGFIISYIAQELFFMEVGDKFPLVMDLEKKYKASRGTIQNAISYLKEAGCVRIVSKGQLGSYIKGIDYKALQNQFIHKPILGVMPFPYSKTYMGIATGIINAFNAKSIEFSMSYNRGSLNRFKLVEKGYFTFAIASKLSAVEAIAQGLQIEICKEFGPNTYDTQHVLVYKEGFNMKLAPGVKVGIDPNSYDQKKLTESLIKGSNVTLVELGAQSFLYALDNKQIDCVVWDTESIVSRPSEYKFSKLNYCPEDVSSTVIVVAKGEDFIKKIMSKYIDDKEIVATIKAVEENKMTPIY